MPGLNQFDPGGDPFGPVVFGPVVFTPDPIGDTQSISCTARAYTIADVFAGLTCTLGDYEASAGPFAVTITYNDAGAAVLSVSGIPLPLPPAFTGQAAAAVITGTVNGLPYRLTLPLVLVQGAIGVRLRVYAKTGTPFTDRAPDILYGGNLAYLPLTLTDDDSKVVIDLTDKTVINGVQMALVTRGEPVDTDWRDADTYADAPGSGGQAGPIVGAVLYAPRGVYYVWVRALFVGGGQVSAKGRDLLRTG